jgi:predicted AlkP superfamily phosphohydrolase/phosphomutase
VIGIDGATFDVIKPLISEDRLPNLSKLMDEGVYGDLRSTIPHSSIPAWPSFLTGVNPGKHGVFDFLKRIPGEYIGSVSNSNDLRSPTIYDILSENDKINVTINVTGTFPPKKVKGCLISGFLTPDGADYVYPSILKNDLESMGYWVYKDLKGILDSNQLYDELLSLEERRKDVALSLMKIFDWEFFMVMIIGTDTLQHKLWGENKKIYHYYCEIDRIVGELIEPLDDNVNVIVVSDHGSGPTRKIFYINKWLQEIGLLDIKTVQTDSTRSQKIRKLQNKKSDSIAIFLGNIGVTKRRLRSFVKSPLISKIRWLIPSIVIKKYSRLPEDNLAIDWSRTQVALSSFFGNQSIMINLCGREPEGIVLPEDYESLRKHVILYLEDIKDPQTGDTIVERVFTREELYEGPYLDEAPDIVMMLKGSYKASNSLLADGIIGELTDDKIKGSHRQHGIFIAWGPDIKRGCIVNNASIYDMMPTILKLMKVDIPINLDGQALTEILR